VTRHTIAAVADEEVRIALAKEPEAARRYGLVDPAKRLVARELEAMSSGSL
jgi:hypothetical protein